MVSKYKLGGMKNEEGVSKALLHLVFKEKKNILFPYLCLKFNFFFHQTQTNFFGKEQLNMFCPLFEFSYKTGLYVCFTGIWV